MRKTPRFQLTGVEILWKRTVSAEFRVNSPKPSRNCTFSLNSRTRKLGEITVFYGVHAKYVRHSQK